MPETTRTTAPAQPDEAARLVPVRLHSVRIYEPDWPDHLTPMTEVDVRLAFNPIAQPKDAGTLTHEGVVRVAERIAALLNEARLRIGGDLRMALLQTTPIEPTAAGGGPGAGPGEARYLPVVIGFADAAALLLALRGPQTPRPLTHELLGAAIGALGARVARVAIVEHTPYTLPYRGVDYPLPLFSARIVLDAGGREVELDARPSDALVLAVRTGAPLFVREGVLRAGGFTEGERAGRLVSAQHAMKGGFREPPVPS